jgi:hypothetical protein
MSDQNEQPWLNMRLVALDGSDHKIGDMGVRLNPKRMADRAVLRKYQQFIEDHAAWRSLTAAKQKKVAEPTFSLNMQFTVYFPEDETEIEI